MSCEKAFARALKRHGLRMTPQRELVLAALHDGARPMTADEVYQVVQLTTSALDKATVYRSLDLLEELELVRRLDFGDAVRRYELALHDPHVHLICERCEKRFVADADLLEDLAEDLRQRVGFALDLEQVVLQGVCSRCRDAGAQGDAAQHAAAEGGAKADIER